MRFLRLALGIALIVQGAIMKDVMFIIFGVFFSLMPLLNIGCASGNCSVPQKRNSKLKREIEFEEVK